MSYATVRAANSTELDYIRRVGQWSRLYLAFLNPPVVYSAQLSSVPSSKDRVVEITFTGGTGTLADVMVDMTLYVGTTAGAYDLGMARIRKTPIAGTFYIGEESEINWQTSCHLTVVMDFDIWAKHIRTVSDTEFYMDWDVTYTNQNSTFDPIPIMGGHRVLKLTGATVSTIFDFSNSYVIGSTISGYSLSVPTASGITGGTTATPTVTFDTEGWHLVTLTVTAANGKTYFGVRWVYIYSATSMPVTGFQIGNCAVDYETGGWSFDITMQSQIALANVPERALCILFSEDYYGSTQASIGQLAGCENIVCVGRISDESYTINAEQGEVSLRIQGNHYWLSKVYAFPTGVLLTASAPTNWAEMQSPTVDKVVYRLLRWGSTAMKVMDVYLTNDTKIASELISPASNLWAQLVELSQATIQGNPGVDRFGRMFVEVEPQLVPLASRTWATVMTLTKKDWHDTINIQRMAVSSTGMVDVSGVVVDSSGDGGALFGLSPGHVFKHYGSPEVVDRMLLLTQTLTNQQAGLFLGWRNNPFPNSEFRLSGNNRMIDCFPRQKIAWSIVADDTPRTFTLSGNFIPRRVEFNFDDDSGFMEVLVSLELESVEQLSVNGDIPGSGDADLSDPPDPPPFPDIPPFGIVIVPSDVPSGSVDIVLMMDAAEGIVRTANFSAGSPTWEFWNTGIDSADVTLMSAARGVHWFRTPNGAVYVAVVNKDNGRNFDIIYRAPSIGGTFVKAIDQTWLNSNWATNGKILGIGYNPLKPEEVAMILCSSTGFTGAFYLGAVSTFTQKSTFGTATLFAGRLSYGGGKWIFDLQNGSNTASTIKRFNATGTTLELTSASMTNEYHYRPGTTAKIFKLQGTGIKYSPDNGTTIDTIADTDDFNTGHIALSPEGLYMMANWDFSGQRGKSPDGGNSWSGLPNLPFGGNFVFAYAGGSGVNSRWIAARGMVRHSNNFGDAWEDKIGNLLLLIPTNLTITSIIPVLPSS